ncbi:MAG: NAD(P)-dependent glycerol-3-phosphate dehydrogenase [Spirochaetales bacterium]|nr:NAD(P)-dependent glycerol-3-phosphate dehydrogenase [Spirochaetales bacterium]
MKAAVIGSGAWGTALALLLARNKHDVVIWSHDPRIAETINKDHENTELFRGVELPPSVSATTNLEDAVRGAELVILVVASRFFRQTLTALLPLIGNVRVLLSATKGMDPDTDDSPVEMAEHMLPTDRKHIFAVLSGPNIAREIASGKPATTVVASHHEPTALLAQEYLSTPEFRVYTNDDVAGIELGGTLKNIIAIAAGILDGMELGVNARAALVVRGMVEMVRFGTHFGARPETFAGLAGMGDLIATCSSPMSRNHTVGEKLAKGLKLKEILEQMNAVAEGVETTARIHRIATEKGIEMPVTAQVHAILFEDKPVKQAIYDLMTRDLKSESPASSGA